MKVLFLASILCLAAGTANASDSVSCEAARTVVDRYIALDLAGEGLHTSERMGRLIDYQGRDTPGWDSFMLTSESKIKSCKESGAKIIVAISHMVLGESSGNDGFAETIRKLSPNQPKEEITELRLNKTAQGWKIDSSSVYVPHVGVDALKALVEMPERH